MSWKGWGEGSQKPASGLCRLCSLHKPFSRRQGGKSSNPRSPQPSLVEAQMCLHFGAFLNSEGKRQLRIKTQKKVAKGIKM